MSDRSSPVSATLADAISDGNLPAIDIYKTVIRVDPGYYVLMPEGVRDEVERFLRGLAQTPAHEGVGWLSDYRNSIIEECAAVCEGHEWTRHATHHSPTKSCAIAIRALADSSTPCESESDLREENLRSLLREARQYVSDDFINDDMEMHKHSASLLKDIDAALSISSIVGEGK